MLMVIIVITKRENGGGDDDDDDDDDDEDATRKNCYDIHYIIFLRALRISPAVTRLTVYRQSAMTNFPVRLCISVFSKNLIIRFNFENLPS